MKRILGLFAIAICCSAFGQSEKATLFGIKGGWNRSVINGQELDGSKTGFIGNEVYGGFFSDTKINNRWHFENELLFSWTDDYHFIEVPLHIKYFVHEKWNIFFGPKMDIIVDNDNNDFESGYNFQNVGVSADMGVQYLFLKRLVAEIRYSYGLVEQVDDLALEIYGGKRNTLRVGVGYQF